MQLLQDETTEVRRAALQAVKAGAKVTPDLLISNKTLMKAVARSVVVISTGEATKQPQYLRNLAARCLVLLLKDTISDFRDVRSVLAGEESSTQTAVIDVLKKHQRAGTAGDESDEEILSEWARDGFL